MIHRPLVKDAEPQGRTLWRSLDELADTDEFRDFLVREFPSTLPEFQDPGSRRQFLRVMGASLALAGVSGCVYTPPEKIVPYVKQPDRIIPGQPLFFASAFPMNGYATGVLVESHMGRPTKIEGNPSHPASLGATDIFAQASVLDLYDPDRSKVLTHNGRVSTYDVFLGKLVTALANQKSNQGQGIRILTGTLTSPSLVRQIRGLLGQLPDSEKKKDPTDKALDEFPKARWHSYEPTDTGAARAGVKRAFDKDAEPVYHFENADVIVSLDADFLSWSPSKLVDARKFAERRETIDRMNRLYVVEPAPTITGGMADHRLSAKPSQIAQIAKSIGEAIANDSRPQDAWVARVVADLKANPGRSLVLAGNTLSAEVHALAHTLNATLGNLGKTIEFVEPIAANPMDDSSSITALVRDIEAGQVSILLILGGNPAYDAPAELNFAEKLRKVAMSIHLGTHADETALASHWHVPEAHFLETWGDVRAFDGTATIQQPLIKPLYGGRTALELVSAMRGRPEAPPMELVQDAWRTTFQGDFDAKWRSAVREGVIPDSAAKKVEVAAKGSLADALAAIKPMATSNALEIAFRPDATIWDGRFSNNGWLQELPKPLSKLTWDNAALVSVKTAERLDLKNEQKVGLTVGGRTVTAAIWLDPGHADDVISLSLGYGRTAAGKVGTGAGFNAYLLRTSDAPWQASGLELKPTGETYQLATTQHHHDMEGRAIVRVASVAEFHHDRHFVEEREESPLPALTLYEPYNYDGYKWGMAINLNTCIGCNACVTACQAENNCPVVGKDQVLSGRELHWIRIDRYYEGPKESPTAIYHQPVPCMHCENAPCELVCPVNATVHDAEGLNVMVYNRCVGTRYCSNNCPYKVRRFNFLQYSEQKSETQKMQNNPEVTVRTRGVMEKCTYCVQRIVNHRIIAEEENRTLRDGEMITACQAVCPTRAIVFGDLNDKSSAVVKAKADPRNYSLLASLNTRPRTTYIAKITNPKEA